MKILFYINALSGGGAERVLTTLLHHFSKDISLELCLATNTTIPFAYSLPNSIRIINLYEGCNIKHNKTFNFFSYRIPYLVNIRKIAKREHPDIIIVFMGNSISNVILMTLGLGIPIIGSEHTNVSRSFGRVFELKRKILYPFASAITVLTKYDYNLWSKKFSNIVRMPNPCDFKVINSVYKKDKRVIAVGRVSDWEIKGFDNLVRAWSKICHEVPEWQLSIVGKYDIDSLSFLKKIQSENQGVNIEFLGFRNDVNRLLLESEIFVLSSRVEGLPMGLIEAMKSKCCCVSFDVKTGPNEIIKDGFSGLLVKDQDVNALAEKLLYVIKNENKRILFSQNAPLSVEQYSIENVIEKWYSLIKRFVK